MLLQADFSPSYNLKNAALHQSTGAFFRHIIPLANFKPVGGVSQGGANLGG